MTTLDKINEEGVSIIIGARNEFPQIAMTITSLMEDMSTSGITKWEFIIMDNGSEDETTRFFAWKPNEKGERWKYQYSPRGLVYENRLRIFFDPVLSNVGTRNRGVTKAKYKNIIFSDAHIIVKPGSVLAVVESLVKYGGIVHAPISWMGASSVNPDPGYQYSYKVGEKIWGTWNRAKVSDSAFAVPICGHAFLAVRKDEFIQMRGYPYGQRVYGGGEPYLDTKYWMCGSHSLMEPRALVYHLSAGRGYNWHSNDLKYNMFLVSYILGDRRWADRIMITYMNQAGTNHALLKHMYDEALRDGEEDKKWLDENKLMTFEECLGLDKEELIRMSGINGNAYFDPGMHDDWYCTKCTKRGSGDPHVMRPWDKWNDTHNGTHRSFVQEFRLREDSGKVFIGNTEITNPDAIELAKKYI